jgi:hypothetical protein
MMQALMRAAGFAVPPVPCNSISPRQFAHFQDGVYRIGDLLRSIARLWCSQLPTIVCGLEVGQDQAVDVLREQPTGTFVCRMALEQPGSFIVSCKVCMDNACAVIVSIA